jgi:hypothetical protein
MKHVVIQEPVDYIEFDDGTKIKYHDLTNDLYQMRNAERTEFYTRDKGDVAVFKLIEERMKQSDKNIGDIVQHSENSITIYWQDNIAFIDDLCEEIVNMVYPENEEEYGKE